MDINIQVLESVQGGCAAIGNFDGVHRGHRRMLEALVSMAKRLSTHSVAVTFHPHPITILRPEYAPPLLTTIPDRTALLRASGVDHVVVLPVTKELMAMTADEFFRFFVMKQLRARGLVEGVNFRFGRDRQGDTKDLGRMCQAAGIALQLTELVSAASGEISSSRIRSLLSAGKLTEATELLGHPYALRGVVQSGAGRGLSLGFPTANLSSVETLIPAQGVYAGVTTFADRQYVVAVSIGPNPTFAESQHKIECFLDDFSGSLYGQQLTVQLMARIRGLQAFDSVEQLIQQIHNDVAACRIAVAGYHQTKAATDQ